MANMRTREKQNFQAQALRQRHIRTELVRLLVRLLTIDQNQLVLLRPQLLIYIELSVWVGHKLAFEPVHRIPVAAQIISWGRSDHPSHAVLGLGQDCELFVRRSHAGGTVGGIYIFGRRVKRLEIRQEAGCWWLVRNHRSDKTWMPGEQFERDYRAGAIANHDGRSFGREVLDETGGVVCVGFKALGIVLRASQVALRKASSWKGVSTTIEKEIRLQIAPACERTYDHRRRS